MSALRRRLASGALALIALQLTVLFAAPVAACCVRAGAAHHEAAPRVEDADCCPPGSHPPGQCPRHRPSRRAAHDAPLTPYRMVCDTPSGQQFVLAVIGIASAPQSFEIGLTRSVLHTSATSAVSLRPNLPDAPPPRL